MLAALHGAHQTIPLRGMANGLGDVGGFCGEK
jgi:hypothetical protein